jgi:ribokinase
VSGRVLVVGSVNVDLVVTVPSLPRAGETVAGGRFARHGGGKSANQAVAAARFGADVALVAAVGDDEFGTAALDELAAEGVDVTHVARLAGVPTGVAAIVVDAGGENQVAVASGANAALDGARVTAALDTLAPAAGDVVLVCFEVSDAVVAAALGARGGAAVVLNPAPARPLGAVAGALLTPNAGEAAALTGEEDPARAAAVLHARTGAPVLVTVGARGALLLTDGAVPPLELPARPADVVDTTGAGDALNGALAAGLARGLPVEAAAREAVAAASASTTVAGARAGMPRRPAQP